jgi:hypothetical protein
MALVLFAGPLSPLLAEEAEERERVPAAEPMRFVGTVIAVVPASRTLVVDVPLGTEVLRIGAEVTKETKITAAGAAASFDSLKVGARVRINFRKVATGDEALSVDVLRSPKS